MEKKLVGIKGETDRRSFYKMLIRKDISLEELKEYTDALPDVSENAEEIIVEISDEAVEESHDD